MTHLQVAVDIARSLGRSPSEVEEIVGSGSMNRVFAIEDLIVRLDHDRSAEEALTEYRREAWCHARATAAGIRVPAIYEVGMLGGRAFIAMERVPGRLARNDEVAVWRSLGDVARRVHEIGDPCEEDRTALFTIARGKTGREAWQEILERNVAELVDGDPLEGFGVYALDERNTLRAAFEALLDYDFQYGLCHGDLAARNVIVEPNGGLALIDWGCATLGPVPHEDLCEIVRKHQLQDEATAATVASFVEGYGEAATRAMAISPAVMQVKAFDLVRWALARCPTRLEELVTRAKAVRHRNPLPA
jgi:aminoglycoside phosphotransferase (APT) family kinase protein